MAKIIPSQFSLYAWDTEEEQLYAAIFKPENIQFLQNEIAMYAQHRLNLEYDLNNTISFVQREAELKGKIQVLQWLVDSHFAALEASKKLENPPLPS